MRALATVGFVLLVAAPVVAQTNPCTDAAGPLLLTPTDTPSAVMVLEEFALTFPDGTQRVTGVQVGVFPVGADPVTAVPVALVTVPRAGITLAPGTKDCYQMVVALSGLQVGAEYVVAAHAMNASGFLRWVTGNTFVMAGVPAVPVSVRISRTCATLPGETRMGGLRTVSAVVTTGTAAAQTIAAWTAAGWVDIFWGSSTIVGVCRE